MLDTWFSSGALAVLDARLAERDRRARRSSIPRAILETGYDILFFWVARMMMFGLYFMDGRAVHDGRACTAWSATRPARRCRRRIGNVIDPLDWMDEVRRRTPLRFTLARGANPGPDIPIGQDRIQGSRNFVNKIWNASRFAMMNGAVTTGELTPPSSCR